MDDRKTGERLYPPDKLRKWKQTHEGSNGPALAMLGPVDEDSLTELLLEVFDPPVKRLEKIADQLEQTGTLNARTVLQLRQLVDVLSSAPPGPDTRTAALLAQAADIFSTGAFRESARALGQAADILPVYDRQLRAKLTQWQQLADVMTTAANAMKRHGQR